MEPLPLALRIFLYLNVTGVAIFAYYNLLRFLAYIFKSTGFAKTFLFAPLITDLFLGGISLLLAGIIQRTEGHCDLWQMLSGVLILISAVYLVIAAPDKSEVPSRMPAYYLDKGE